MWFLKPVMWHVFDFMFYILHLTILNKNKQANNIYIYMNIDFQNSAARLSFLCCIMGINVAWINWLSRNNKTLRPLQPIRLSNFFNQVLKITDVIKTFLLGWYSKGNIFFLPAWSSEDLTTGRILMTSPYHWPYLHKEI